MKQKRALGLSRRAFASVVAGGTGAASLWAREQAKPLAQDSVPGDPDAPKPQAGTLAERGPFDGKLLFTRKPATAKAQPFPLTEVRLLPSAFKDAQEADRSYMQKLPADRLLHVFRLNAGIPSSAEPLGGWEKPDCELRGHFVGHFLSGCALMYASTGDTSLKEKGDYLVGELAKCQQKLGGEYLSAFPLEYFDRLDARKKVWAPFYTVHKIMAGMLDMHQCCGNQQALTVLKGMADWADKWTAAMPEDHLQAVLDTEYGGMNEVLYNLAAVTKEDRYAEAGDRFTKKRFFNPLALRRDQLLGLHTNTHIPQVIGAARRYELSSDARFHDVADYFWTDVVQSRTYATGGTSNNEGWLAEPNHLAEELAAGVKTNECCCAYNMLKLTRMLYTWTADPRYFDYYERTLYNHRLGTILKTGETQYYLGVVPASWRTFATPYASFWCCNGTGVEEYAKLNDSIYFHDGNGIYVNLFIPSEVSWADKGIKLRQETRFPEAGSTRLTVDVKEPLKTAVHIRVPAWMGTMPVVRVNGKAAEISATPGSYLSLLRTWKSGDHVEVDMPMRLYTEGLSGDSTMQAILYGPLVLAGELGSDSLTEDLTIGPMGAEPEKHPFRVPSFETQGRQISQWVQPVAGQPLRFNTVGQSQNVNLVPFYAVAGQRYSLYWKMS